jgi:uncharacterized membrane protein
MEGSFERFAAVVALLVEGGAVLLILVGALEALILLARPLVRREDGAAERRVVWQRFARWLILALEFELAADIVRTAISPSWTDIGQLGAIAVIRTALNYFLERDVEHAEALQRARLEARPPSSPALEARDPDESPRRDVYEARQRGEHVPA